MPLNSINGKIAALKGMATAPCADRQALMVQFGGTLSALTSECSAYAATPPKSEPQEDLDNFTKLTKEISDFLGRPASAIDLNNRKVANRMDAATSRQMLSLVQQGVGRLRDSLPPATVVVQEPSPPQINESAEVKSGIENSGPPVVSKMKVNETAEVKAEAPQKPAKSNSVSPAIKTR